MISEGSCDTENSALITGINYIHFLFIVKIFYCIFDQINAALVNRRGIFLNVPTPKLMVIIMNKCDYLLKIYIYIALLMPNIFKEFILQKSIVFPGLHFNH